MTGFYGADVAALRALAAAFESSGRTLHETATLLSSSIGAARWPGPDGERFGSDWTRQHRSVLVRAGDALAAGGQALRRNADAQEQTSAAAGGSSSGGSNPGLELDGGGGGVGDRPGDPTLPDDLGDYVPIENPISFDDDALDADEINQGQVGDCWLLASLGAVVDQDPEWIRDHMWQNPDGTWTVKMYDEDGEAVYIQVDPTVPENGARDSDGDPSWVSIYEKAAAEFFGGSYGDIDGDWPDRALTAITGQQATNAGQLSLDEISDALDDGPVVVSTQDNPDDWWRFWSDDVDDTDRIVPNHAYIVRDVFTVTEEDGTETQYIQVTNPWGPNGGERYGTYMFTAEEFEQNFAAAFVGTPGED
jgi:uncharacterized protein YukE